MSTQKKHKNSKKANGKNSVTKFQNPTLTSWNGPLMLPKSLEQDNVIAVNFSYFFPLNATVGGSIDNVYADSSVVNANDWASIAAAFHEYRVLAFRMQYMPLVSYTTNYPALVTVVDRFNNGTLGAYVAAANHESVRLWSSRYPAKVTAKMIGIEESDFVQTSGSSAHFYIKQFGTGFTASQNVGNILFTYLVQFRGRA